VALQNKLGVPSRLLSVDEIHRHAPLLNLDGVVGGTFYERDGLADPNSVVQGYINKTRQISQTQESTPVTLLTDTPVTGIRMAGGRVQAVLTPVGEISTGAVVIAAGAWSGQIGQMIEVDIPIEPVRRQIAVTTPLEGVPTDFPFVLYFSQSLYFHPESGRSVLTGMSNKDETPGFKLDIDRRWTETHLLAAMERRMSRLSWENYPAWMGSFWRPVSVGTALCTVQLWACL
jgi:sarcosine oxidase subunit beta